MTIFARKFFVGAVSASVFLACAAGVGAYSTSEECDFAEALASEFRLSDFAMKALDELQVKAPASEKGMIVAARISVLSVQGKLTNAEALVASLPKGPDADDARVALAKAYFRLGQVEKAKGIFLDYFKAYPEPPKEPARLKRFRDVCSLVGGMMKAAGDELAAADAGRRFLKTNPEEEIADAVRCDLAVLLITAAKKFPDKKDAVLKEAEALCDTVLKHGINLFWGQALVAKANIMMLRGDRAGAQKLIKEQSDVLIPLDDYLREHRRLGESPRAGILMMNAQIAEDDAKAAMGKKDQKTALTKYSDAFRAYWTIFLTYGESDYGMPAGAKANEIKKVLEGAPFNKEVKTRLTMEQESRIVGYQFRIADQKRLGKDYKGAIPEYLKVLGDYPESDRSVRAVGSLLQCYAESEDKVMVKATASYIGERFRNRAFAAPLISALISFYYSRKDEAMFFFVCNAYVNNFPKDQNASQVLYFMASTRLATNDYLQAAPLLERIVSNPDYKNDKAFVQALQSVGGIQMAASNYAGAAESFRKYADSVPAGLDKYSALTRLADAMRLSQKYAEAIPIYQEVVQKISDPASQLLTATMKETADKARDTLERASFNLAVCYSRLTDDVDANRAKATAAYEDFLKRFPASTNYAPKAMAGRGQVFLLMDKFDDAAKVFQELSTKYPNTPEGKNALISLVQSALEIKRLDQAKKAFAQMMAGSANVSHAQLVQMGQVWLDNGVYAEAAQTYKGVIGKTQDRNLEQPALFGYGKAQFHNKEFKESADALANLLKKYERTPYFFESKLLLAGALRETGRSKEAEGELGDILVQPSATVEQKMQAQFEILMIQLKDGKKKEALASALRNVGLAVLAKEDNPVKLAWLEKMTMAGITVGQELMSWKEVLELCEGYLALMPQGRELDAVRKARAEAVSKSGAP